MKICPSCKKYEEFSKNKASHDGLQSHCKKCVSCYQKKWAKENREKWLQRKKNSNKKMSKEAKENKNILNTIRGKRLKKATPKWADKEEIKRIYKIAKENGLVVDHIIPLNNKIVCGLNVPNNLRCISEKWNRNKYNKFNQDYISKVLTMQLKQFTGAKK